MALSLTFWRQNKEQDENTDFPNSFPGKCVFHVSRGREVPILSRSFSQNPVNPPRKITQVALSISLQRVTPAWQGRSLSNMFKGRVGKWSWVEAILIKLVKTSLWPGNNPSNLTLQRSEQAKVLLADSISPHFPERLEFTISKGKASPSVDRIVPCPAASSKTEVEVIF